MTDNNDKSGDDTRGDASKRTLSLRGGSGGSGRPVVARSTRSVVVEKRTRRVAAPGSGASPRPHGANSPSKPAAPSAGARSAPANRTQGRPPQNRSASGRPSPSPQRPRVGLTQTEAHARERVLREAAARAAEEAKLAQADVLRRAEEDARRQNVRDEQAREIADKAARAEEAARPTPAPTAAKPKPAAAPKDAVVNPADMPVPPSEDDSRVRRTAPSTQKGRAEAERARRPNAAPDRPAGRPGAQPGRTRGRLTVTTALNDSDRDRSPSLAAMRRRREKQRGRPREAQAKISRVVTLPESITVQELANRMAERAVDVIKLLMQQDQMLTVNDTLDPDTAELIATEMGHTVTRVAASDVESGLFDDLVDEDDSDSVTRPPVVTIMGHVDHGKTSLLDALRKTKVVDGEAGGITQHIGAYQVEVGGQTVTFLDTPGHEAFTSMRARGANATDIAVLVVAADDGVMPQTIESIKHAKAAKVPIIVAINKIDKQGADANRVRTELLQHEVFVESMGGDTLDVEVSALEGTNLDKLLETLVLQAELLELKARPTGRADGVVIEAKLDRGRGAVATVLVQRGELAIGDIIVAGTEWARVRALISDKGDQIKQAPPSSPVEVLGFSGVPSAGDQFVVVETEARAREVTEYRQRLDREGENVTPVASLEQMMDQLKTSDLDRVPLVVKGDVQGSVEAINSALEKLGNDEVSAQILTAGVGAITESDVTLARASNAVVLGFNVRANKQAQEAAKREGVEIRYYNVIYNLVDDVKAAMSGMLSPEIRETFLGNAQILEVFNITKVGKVAGCRVTEGTVERGAGVRLIRDGVVIHEGKLSTLKRFKDEVKDVQSGQECGMAFENYQDMRAADVIECFRVEEISREL